MAESAEFERGAAAGRAPALDHPARDGVKSERNIPTKCDLSMLRKPGRAPMSPRSIIIRYDITRSMRKRQRMLTRMSGQLIPESSASTCCSPT